MDLKFHDIPNTVAKACTAAAKLGVWIVNVHASGGPKMMSAAAEALSFCHNRPKLIAVTVLTSMDDEELKAVGINTTAALQVERLAKLAKEQLEKETGKKVISDKNAKEIRKLNSGEE